MEALKIFGLVNVPHCSLCLGVRSRFSTQQKLMFGAAKMCHHFRRHQKKASFVTFDLPVITKAWICN
jgi:hypothetical protein